MAAAAIIPAIITAVAGVASAAIGRGGRRDTPQLPPPQPVPQTVEPDKTKDQLLGVRPENAGDSPNFLRMGAGMTPLQKRTQFATFATSGDDSRYKDPAAKEYYKKLAMTSLLDPSGNITGAPTPIERQYVTNVLGQEVRDPDSTESFLSALMRG